MIFITWNCWGVGNRRTKVHAKEVMRMKDVGAFFFLETKDVERTRDSEDGEEFGV